MTPAWPLSLILVIWSTRHSSGIRGSSCVDRDASMASGVDARETQGTRTARLEPPLDEDLVEVRHLRVYRLCEGRLLAHEVGALQRLRLALALLVVVRDLTCAESNLNFE